MENWFPISEVSENCRKRAEVKEIILARMAETGIKSTLGIELPMLDFNDTNASTLTNQVQPNSALVSTVKPTSSQCIPKQKNNWTC